MKKITLLLAGLTLVGVSLLSTPIPVRAEDTLSPSKRPTISSIRQQKWLKTLLRKTQSKAVYA